MSTNPSKRYFTVRSTCIVFFCILIPLLTYSLVKYKIRSPISEQHRSSNTNAKLRTCLTVSEYLNITYPKIVSPNALFILELEKNGDLKLKQSLQHQNVPFGVETKYWERDIWWTSTGDAWPMSHQVILTPAGVLKVQLKDPKKTEWRDIWMSTLLDGCDITQSDNNEPAVLSLENSGALQIFKGMNVVCTLNTEVYSHRNSTSVSPNGRLAVIVAGLFRSFPKRCETHMEKVIRKWPGKSVDIFIFTYIQDAHLPAGQAVTKETIEDAIRKCYGNNLKGMSVEDVTKIEQQYPSSGKELNNCGHKLHRLYSQVKTIHLAGQLMRRYMLSEGITYDYVFRFRPDTDFWGNIPALPRIDFEQTKIYIIHPAGEHYFWCRSHDGTIRVGVSDQLAYGRLAAMNIYLDLYLAFPYLVAAAKGNIEKPAKMDYTACQDKIENKICHNQDPCSIECTVNYWVVLSGLKPVVWWEWQQNRRHT